MDLRLLRKAVFLLILIPASLALAQHPSPEGAAEYCSAESFDVQCGENEAILVESALYGRMSTGRCVSSTYTDSIGCHADVLQYMDSQCSGRQTCKFLIATLEAVAQPCMKDFKSYLQAKYTCVKVNAVRVDTCHPDQMRHLVEPRGIIAAGTVDMKMESLTCRWAIQVKQGQGVALNLLAFHLISLEDWLYPEDPHGGHGSCAVSVTVLERNERTRIDVCNIRQREKEIYLSKNHLIRVEISIRRKASRTPRFMIRYRARGCQDILPEPNTWVSRTGDSHMVVKCNETNETWFLTCRDDKWIGVIGNCTTSKQRGYNQAIRTGNSFEGWIVFAIIIGIVLGLLVGTSLLTIALMWRKRHREDQQGSPRCSIEEPGMEANCTTASRTSYPALLRQEKPMGDVSEYTHVWEVHAPVLAPCHDGQHLHTCKMADLQNQIKCTSNKDGNSSFRSGESGYESPMSQEDKPIIIPRNLPLYFDMQEPQSGHNTCRRTVT